MGRLVDIKEMRRQHTGTSQTSQTGNLCTPSIVAGITTQRLSSVSRQGFPNLTDAYVARGMGFLVVKSSREVHSTFARTLPGEAMERIFCLLVVTISMFSRFH